MIPNPSHSQADLKVRLSIPPPLIGGVLLCLVLAAVAQAQDTQMPSLPGNSPFMGGVPQGTATTETLSLSAIDVIHRALEYNLGVLLANDGVNRARGARLIALSELLPNLHASIGESRQLQSLEVFGFPLGDTLPPVVGPFNVFDARVFLSQTIFDLHALNETHAETHNEAASRHSYRSARDLVVLVAANLYLQAQAASARADSARAQLATAQALLDQAQDLKQGGIIAGIDVVRADVRLATDRQRATAAENNFQKAKLQLARVIGLPLGQAFTLIDQIPNVPMPDMDLQVAVDRAYRERADFLAAQERLLAAEARHQAAHDEAMPTVRVNADYGGTGLTAGTARSTFRVSGVVNIPIFEGGHVQGRLLETEADLRSRRAEVEDLRAAVYYEVRTAFLDLQATSEQLQVATRGRELANQVLTQSRDRFGAGVASSIEVVEAQEAVALASEQYIGALYSFNVSKAMLARSLGSAEESALRYLGGSNP